MLLYVSLCIKNFEFNLFNCLIKRNLLERFTNPTIRVNPGKSFVRGNIKNLIILSTYIPGIKVSKKFFQQ